MKRLLLLVGVPVLALLVVGIYYLKGGRYAETEDAYVQSSMILVSPEISGVVSEVDVKENQQVKAGDVIFKIDSAPFTVAVQRAEAKIEQVKVDFAVLKASVPEKQSEIDAAKIKYGFAQRTFVRQSALAAKNVLSEQAMDDATQAAQVAEDQTVMLQSDLARIVASLGGNLDTPIEQYPAYLSAQTDLAQAKLDLERTVLKAPAEGYVSKLPAIGQYETLGLAALVLVTSNNMRVDANYTETEITYVKVGQPVTVTVDTYPGVTWKGVVQSLSPATGAAYSVIPAQNATGNWVKIAQRVPVRIKLEPNPDGPQLRLGMSAYVSIDTGHQRDLLGFHL